MPFAPGLVFTIVGLYLWRKKQKVQDQRDNLALTREQMTQGQISEKVLTEANEDREPEIAPFRKVAPCRNS
jgi:hypothetical protein